MMVRKLRAAKVALLGVFCALLALGVQQVASAQSNSGTSVDWGAQATTAGTAITSQFTNILPVALGVFVLFGGWRVITKMMKPK